MDAHFTLIFVFPAAGFPAEESRSCATILPDANISLLSLFLSLYLSHACVRALALPFRNLPGRTVGRTCVSRFRGIALFTVNSKGGEV